MLGVFRVRPADPGRRGARSAGGGRRGAGFGPRRPRAAGGPRPGRGAPGRLQASGGGRSLCGPGRAKSRPSDPDQRGDARQPGDPERRRLDEFQTGAEALRQHRGVPDRHRRHHRGLWLHRDRGGQRRLQEPKLRAAPSDDGVREHPGRNHAFRGAPRRRASGAALLRQGDPDRQEGPDPGSPASGADDPRVGGARHGTRPGPGDGGEPRGPQFRHPGEVSNPATGALF